MSQTVGEPATFKGLTKWPCKASTVEIHQNGPRRDVSSLAVRRTGGRGPSRGGSSQVTDLVVMEHTPTFVGEEGVLFYTSILYFTVLNSISREPPRPA